MLIVKSTERNCCTCDHWSGTRIIEDDGYVYSLENLDGICMQSCRVPSENVTFSAPSGTCLAWQRWEGFAEPLNLDFAEYDESDAAAPFAGSIKGRAQTGVPHQLLEAVL